MATYTRPDKFIPVNISSDPTAYLEYAQKRMDLSAQGEAAIKTQYKKLVDLELTHDANKNILNSFLSESTEKLNKSLAKDLSNYDNVKQALSLFEPLSKDEKYKPILYDNAFTKHYASEFKKADNFKQEISRKGKVGEFYSDDNYKVLVHNYKKFKDSADPLNPKTWGERYTYQPYYDYQSEKQEIINKFHKIPDDYEQEIVDPRTGMTTKIKYEGKRPETLKAFLENNLSSQALSQMKLEGTARSYDIKDDVYISSLTESTSSALKRLEKEQKDLKIFSSLKGNSFSKEEKQKYLEDLKIQKQQLNQRLNDLKDPLKYNEFVLNKENDISTQWVNNLIEKDAQVFSNYRESLNLGTNTAVVSMLNRQQDAEQFLQTLEYNYKKLELDKFKSLLKEGIDPSTGLPFPSSSDGIVSFTTNEETVDSVKQKVDDHENQINEQIIQRQGETVDMIKDIIRPSGNEKEQNEIAVEHLYNDIIIPYKNNDPEILRIKNTPYSDLKNKRERTTKKILENIDLDDAHVNYAIAFKSKKDEITKKAKTELKAAFKESGLTEKELNNAINSTGIPILGVIPAIMNEVVKAVQGKSKPKNLDQIAEELIKNPDLLEKVENNLRSYPQAIKDGFYSFVQRLNSANSWIGYITGMEPFEEFAKDLESQKTPKTFKNNINNVYKELEQNFILSKPQKTFFRPVETLLPQEKVKSANFFNNLNQYYAKYPEQLSSVNKQGIESYTVGDGFLELKYRELDSENKPKKDLQTLKVPIKEKLLSDENETLLKTMVLGNGKMSMKTRQGNNYTIMFESETPFSTIGSDKTLIPGNIVLQMDINGSLVTLPGAFTNPTDAKKAMEETMSQLYSTISKTSTNENVQKDYIELQKQNKSHDEIIKELTDRASKGKYNQDFEKIWNKVTNSNMMYSVFGLNDPSIPTSTRNALDFINSIPQPTK